MTTGADSTVAGPIGPTGATGATGRLTVLALVLLVLLVLLALTRQSLDPLVLLVLLVATGPAGQDGAGGGGATLAAGAGVTLSSIVAGVGYTLGIDPTAVIHVAGVSADEGITANILNSGEYGHYIEMNRANDKIAIRPQGALQYIFGVSTFVSGVGSNTFSGTVSVDGLAHLKSGISSDIGITTGGPIKTQFLTIDNADAQIKSDTVTLKALNSIGHGLLTNTATARIMYLGSSSKSLEVGNGYGKSNQLFIASAGISMDAAGITFPDGTFQSSAASGSGVTAGAGMVLTGSTLGIDPTAVVHVAGISSDGGITVGNLHIDGYTILDPSNTTDFVALGANKAEFYQNNDRTA